jgi:hypothetical protein
MRKIEKRDDTRGKWRDCERMVACATRKLRYDADCCGGFEPFALICVAIATEFYLFASKLADVWGVFCIFKPMTIRHALGRVPVLK